MSVRVIIGDALEQLRLLPDESVHCCVTSPPYYGLRDYGTAQWDGGAPDCDHSPEARGGRFATPVSSKQASNNGSGTASRRDCSCGARRIDRQIGLEPSPAEYIAALVAVFREVRRVLRKDGTAWVNIGDSYAGSGKGGNPEAGKQATNKGSQTVGVLYGIGDTARQAAVTNVTRGPVGGCKPKDLIGIPWMLAFALRDDGWWLRQDIIWSKPNPMPESVTDRCTKAHEYLFLLSKSERYWFDAEAIKEMAVGPAGGNTKPNKSYEHDPIKHRTKASLFIAQQKAREAGGFEYRNKRTVWEVPSNPFPEAHFATFPPALIEPCILAGCPKQCCARCGAPWERVTEREAWSSRPNSGAIRGSQPAQRRTYGAQPQRGNMHCDVTTTGWRSTCDCDASIARGTVLDPFGGAGTTGLVADRLGRDAILIELNPEYAEIARRRIRGDAPLFAEVA